jgi:hypothetical protein
MNVRDGGFGSKAAVITHGNSRQVYTRKQTLCQRFDFRQPALRASF